MQQVNYTVSSSFPKHTFCVLLRASTSDADAVHCMGFIPTHINRRLVYLIFSLHCVLRCVVLYMLSWVKYCCVVWCGAVSVSCCVSRCGVALWGMGVLGCGALALRFIVLCPVVACDVLASCVLVCGVVFFSVLSYFILVCCGVLWSGMVCVLVCCVLLCCVTLCCVVCSGRVRIDSCTVGSLKYVSSTANFSSTRSFRRTTTCRQIADVSSTTHLLQMPSYVE